jgi:hypothetical protein
MPAVEGLLLLLAAVLPEFPQRRKALVRVPPEQLEMSSFQIAHGTSSSREMVLKNRRKTLLHHLPLGRIKAPE